MKTCRVLLSFGILLLFLGLCPGCSAQQTPGQSPAPQAVIAPGVTVHGQTVGGMTYDQAAQALTPLLDAYANQLSLTIRCNGQDYVLPATLLRPSISLQDTLSRALNAPANTALDLQPNFLPDPGELADELQQIAQACFIAPQDAQVQRFDPTQTGDQRWQVVPEVPGQQVDPAALYAQVERALADRALQQPLVITPTPVPAAVTQQQLQQGFQLVATYSTELLSAGARDVNIVTCTQALTGQIVLPGQQFSINQTTGPRTPEAGYEQSSAIVNGRIVDQLGGGICQVAGTLYNAVLRADLQVVERHNHSLVSLYLPPALDASLVYGSKDFIFLNTRDTPIYIEGIADTQARRLTFNLYGTPLPDGVHIDCQSEVTQTIEPPNGYDIVVDESLPEGHCEVYVKARAGTRAKSWRVYYDANNSVLRREELSEDYYPPTKLVYRVGPNTTVGPQ